MALAVPSLRHDQRLETSFTMMTHFNSGGQSPANTVIFNPHADKFVKWSTGNPFLNFSKFHLSYESLAEVN